MSKRWIYNKLGVKAIRKYDYYRGNRWNKQLIIRLRCHAKIKLKLGKACERHVVCQFNHLYNHELMCLYQLYF